MVDNVGERKDRTTRKRCGEGEIAVGGSQPNDNKITKRESGAGLGELRGKKSCWIPEK